MRFQFSDDRGIAIVAVTMVLVVAALLGGTLIAQTSQDMVESGRTYEDKQSLYLAESAKERAYQEIKNNPDWDGGFFNEVTQEGETEAGTISNITDLPGGSYTLQVVELAPLIPLVQNQVVQITGTGNSGTGRARQVVVVTEVLRENFNIFNNAIFGGAGEVGGVIKGNAQIHGSVHLLGDKVGTGNNALEALDMSGTAIIYNNYGPIQAGSDGIDSDLFNKLPPLRVNDAGLDTLDAKLRVRNGSVGISGTSQIGQKPDDALYDNLYDNPENDDYSAKGPMDGIYIETEVGATQWTGNADVTKSVFSDNGYNNLYDVPTDLNLAVPDISKNEPYYDLDTRTTYTDYDAFFTNPDLGGCLEVSLPPSTNTLTIDGTTSALTTIQASNLNGASLFINGSEFTLTKGGNLFKYAPNESGGGTLVISGKVKINGDVVLGESQGPSSATTITYDGQGTLYAAGTNAPSGNITVHSNILPLGTFPTDDRLGLVARNAMYLAQTGDADLKLAAVFFAQELIKSAKQNQIAGTFVTNIFDMSNNVPKIFQVPSVPYNMPPSMPGAGNLWFVTGFIEKSWRSEFVAIGG